MEPDIHEFYAGPGHVFKEEEMVELWGDVGTMVKPSWIGSVPTTLSSSGAKLKSDQWRLVGALYLPVTLIRLWSEVVPGDDYSQHRRALLDMTMSLLSAIAVATSRETSAANADEYMAHMTRYREQLLLLFPSYKCRPNHHMAMHLGEFLRMYGPVHGWWTFPFERMIGMLGRISTNYKQGKLQLSYTMLSLFLTSRRRVRGNHCPHLASKIELSSFLHQNCLSTGHQSVPFHFREACSPRSS